MASTGLRASGVVTGFDETRTKPLSMIGQVAQLCSPWIGKGHQGMVSPAVSDRYAITGASQSPDLRSRRSGALASGFARSGAMRDLSANPDSRSDRFYPITGSGDDASSRLAAVNDERYFAASSAVSSRVTRRS